MNQPTTDHRPVTTPATTTSPTASPKRPLPRWVAPVGVAVAVCVAGIGVLVYDTNNQPAPPPTDSATEYGTSQRSIQESIDVALRRTGTPQLPDVVVDEASQAGQTTVGDLPAHLVEFEARVSTVESRTAQRLIQESIDAALAERNVAPTSGTGQLLQTGQPDGSWQPTEHASSTAPVANHGCRISGPC